MAEGNFGQDLDESEQAYIAQFDPNDPTHHKGDATPCPYGPSIVPASMPSEFAEPNEDAKEFVSTDEYNTIMAARTMLGDLKKDLAKVCPQIETKLRTLLEGDQEKYEAVKKQCNENLEALLKLLPNYLAKIAPHEHMLKVNYTQLITMVQDKALVEYQTKEEYGEFMLAVKRASGTIFADQKVLLEKLKAIKKAANN